MNNDFRQRVFLPIILPVGVIIGFFGFAFMLSRVLLAVSESASTFIALGLAAYVLAIAGVVSAKPKITSRALTVGVSLGIIGVVAAGLLAASVGMRDLEHAPAEASQPSGELPTEAAEADEADEDQLMFVAVDIDFADAPTASSAGAKEIVLVNDGVADHNVTIPALGDSPVVEASGGETATSNIELEASTYEYFCSVPGHETSMSGEFTVE